MPKREMARPAAWRARLETRERLDRGEDMPRG